MFGILKKDILNKLINVIAWAALSTLYWMNSGHGTDESGQFNGYMVIVTGGWMLMVVLVSLWKNEQHEEKYHGYTFLRTLPVTVGEIVAGKFASMLVMVVMYVAVAFMQLSFFSQTPHLMTVSRVYLLLCANACLIIVGFVYIGIYYTGVSNVMRILMPLMYISVPIFAIYILSSRVIGDLTDLDPIMAFATPASLIGLTLCGLICYTALMMVAVRVKSLQEN